MTDNRLKDFHDMFITPDELAERWRLTRGTLNNWRHQVQGPPYLKIRNQTIRYRVSDVLAYERDGMRGVSLERVVMAIESADCLTPILRKNLLKHIQRELKLK